MCPGPAQPAALCANWSARAAGVSPAACITRHDPPMQPGCTAQRAWQLAFNLIHNLGAATMPNDNLLGMPFLMQHLC